VDTDWFQIGRGISLFRRWKTWWISVAESGKRIRHSLGTHDQAEAVIMAGKLLKDLEAAQASIKRDLIFLQRAAHSRQSQSASPLPILDAPMPSKELDY
jgi:hypothetical protein